MDHDPANPNRIGGVRHAMRCVTEQGAADAVPLAVLIHGQSSEYGDWNGIGHVAPEPAGCRFNGHNARGKRVVTNYAFVVANDIGARSATDLVGARPPREPTIERVLPGMEPRQIVVIRKKLGRR